MGLQQQLGFEARRPNRLQRAAQRLASTRPGSWTFSKALHPLDRRLHRWTHGRVTVPGLVAGLPVVLVTTTGARTGRPRTMPLLGIPFGDELAVVGTNFGQAATPGWVHNLEADPRATVAWRDREVAVVARPAADHERDELWARATAAYTGFPAYRSRITRRTVRLFVLEPATG